MAFNTWSYYFEWARRVGGTLTGGENELKLVRIIAGARGAQSTAELNKTRALRSIAASYGVNSAGYNEVQSLRSIVGALNVTPEGRTLGEMNERDCLAAIIAAVQAPPEVFYEYLQPGGIEVYLQPDGVGTYLHR